MRRVSAIALIMILQSSPAFACKDLGAERPFFASKSKPIASLLKQSMDIMHEDMDAAKASGKADQDFLAMMIPHHEGAINMAKAVLAHSSDEYVRGLALEIIADQTLEIELMKGMLAKVKAGQAAGARN